MWYPNSGDVFARNIGMGAYRPRGHERRPDGGKKLDRNLFTTIRRPTVQIRRQGLRREFTRVGDPLFVDPAQGDFRVKDGSPALKLGFLNFPMDQFGVRAPRLKAMVMPQISPLKTRDKKTLATMGAIHWQGAKLRKIEGQEFSAIGVAADAVGVLAAEVPGGSAAFDAGLRQGDLIQQVNDQAVRNAKELLDAVAAAPKEQTLNLKMIPKSADANPEHQRSNQTMNRLTSLYAVGSGTYRFQSMLTKHSHLTG